ncbi:MAG: hypothetical protein LM571_02665 [Desulfurococcaceae archaeon]|nr:hypothetical protein [Desulfurococcaceae archaeon]
MDYVGLALYTAVLTASILVSYRLNRNLVSPSLAVLTVYYVSTGSLSYAVLSAATVVAYSLLKLALAVPLRGRVVTYVKVRYAGVALATVLASVPLAYLAVRTSYSIPVVDPWTAILLVLTSVYVALATVLLPSTAVLYSRRVWGALDLENMSRVLEYLGVGVGLLASLANVVLHGTLGLVLLLPYVLSLAVSKKLSSSTAGLSRIPVALVAVVAALITYYYGYA